MINLRKTLTLLLFSLTMLASGASAERTLSAGGAQVTLNEAGEGMRLVWSAGKQVDLPGAVPLAVLQTEGKLQRPQRLFLTSETLKLVFPEDHWVEFGLSTYPEFTRWELRGFDPALSSSALRVQWPVPGAGIHEGTLNAVDWQGHTVALVAGSPEVIIPERAGVGHSMDFPGVTHQFVQTTASRTGKFAARFSAESTTSAAGWALQGSSLGGAKLKLKDVAGVAAWVHGDGKGQHLKLQLQDEQHGARDYYLPVDFTGWREVVLTEPALDITKGENLASLLIYYNGIPANADVVCGIDNIRAIVHSDHKTSQMVLLEDFENPDSAWWTQEQPVLELEWNFCYVKPGDSMAVLACETDRLFSVIQDVEKALGILVPHPAGEWNKTSEAVGENYLFLTNFQENQFDEALELARRGGFKRILLGQESWCRSTGHYEVNPKRFTDGLPGLVKTVQRFRAAGMGVGLHLLGASIDNADPYLTPVPDPRLVKDARTTLTAALDERATSIQVETMPAAMPTEDGGYYGDGTVLQVGDELIKYQSRSAEAPFTFLGCERGYFGTRPAAHAPGTPVYHLARSYGYHMFDMDTSLLDEVTSNFAAVANACDIGMVYFDGSESLQGSHGRYNARLINAYLSKLNNPNILVQASSFSHFSWHQLARSASADGHGDLKGYLEERAGVFQTFAAIGIPLDVGWYYGYDKNATPDMYEYILGTTVGYGSTFSFQVSVDAARKHPFTNEILRLIKQYEDLRRSGRVSAAMRKRLQVAEPLIGRAPEEKNRPLDQRRDYRLKEDGNGQKFQRVIYGDWQEQAIDTTTAPVVVAWQVDLTTGPCRTGFQLHLPEAKDAATSVSMKNLRFFCGDKSIEIDAQLQPGQYLTVWPGEPALIHGPGNQEAARLPAPPSEITVGPGTQGMRFEADVSQNAAGADWRVRAIFETSETHDIGTAPLPTVDQPKSRH